MTIWVVTDRHIDHAGMLKHDHRQPGYEEVLEANWRRLVAPADLVIDLGDVILGKNSTLGARNAALPGTKVHVRGNHDARPHWFEHHGYVLSCDYFVRRGVCFSHKPMIPLPPRTKLCIHGHFHDSEHRSQHYRAHPYYTEHVDRYRLIEIETRPEPRRLDEIIPPEELAGLTPLVPQEDPELVAEGTTEQAYRAREFVRIGERG